MPLVNKLFVFLCRLRLGQSEPGDSVMADKGITIKNLPAFLGGKGWFSLAVTVGLGSVLSYTPLCLPYPTTVNNCTSSPATVSLLS